MYKNEKILSKFFQTRFIIKSCGKIKLSYLERAVFIFNLQFCRRYAMLVIENVNVTSRL